MIVGTQPAADLRWDASAEPEVAPSHAAVYFEDDDLVIEDLGSPTGVFISGQRLVGPTRVDRNTKIRLGAAGPIFSVEPALNVTSTTGTRSVTPSEYRPVKPTVSTEKHKSSDRFGRVFFWSNWKPRKGALPAYLIREKGECVDELATAFANRVHDVEPETKVGLAWDAPSQPNISRTIRCLAKVGVGHRACCDISFHRKGQDLYLRFAVVGFSSTVLLRQVLLVLILVVSLGGLTWNAMNRSGAQTRQKLMGKITQLLVIARISFCRVIGSAEI